MANDETRLNLANVLVEEMEALGLIKKDSYRLKSQDPSAGLKEIRTKILGDGRKLTALCFSGGGIRSATFCLGVLQRLAKLGLLSKFDYLSTVSGGGFIGSWLKGWSLRADGTGKKLGITGVEQLIKDAREEPRPVRYLRYYTNYLSPKFGLLSADTWTIVATYLRNLFLNWLVLVPLLMLPLMAPMMYLAMQGAIGETRISHWWTFATGLILLGYSVTRLRCALPSSGKQGLTQGKYLRHCLAPLVLSATALTFWWQQLRGDESVMKELNFWSYCPWLSRVFAPESLFDFSSLLGISLAFYLSIFFIGKIVDRLSGSAPGEGTAIYKKWWKELGAMITTAVVAAGLVWLWTQAFSLIKDPLIYACVAMPTLLAVFTLSEVFYIGVASYFTDEMDREFWARAGAWDLIVMLGWIALGALALYGPALIENLGPLAKAALLGTGTVAGGFAAKLGNSALTSALAGAGEKESIGTKLLSKLGLPLALLVFVIVLMAFLAYVAAWLVWAIADWAGDYWQLPELDLSAWLLSGQWHVQLLSQSDASALIAGNPVWVSAVSAAILFLALVQYGMGRVIHVNKFSLHSAYGNRIMRAYLGASRGDERKPNPFTGFDPNDNPLLTEFARDEVKKPLHVVNIALNLVRGKNLAWQERKAASFTASALHCGGYDVGYRPTGSYGGGKGMTLGTAVTISGAAFTPNAGYHSSPLLTFVMAFFNVRLGWWLGNPRANTAKEPGPTHAASPLIAETFGLTDDEHKWVYLSDGGHFENLGLYEMVARCARRIVVIDAGADPKYEFEDLGNAIRKIRADFGISIEIEEPMKIARRFKGGAYCAVFKIKYSDAHKIEGIPDADIDGEMLYIKPVLNGSEPLDIAQHATTSEEFPHDTTADQFYTESQFESYRMLGFHELDTVVDQKTVNDIAALIELGRRHRDAALP